MENECTHEGGASARGGKHTMSLPLLNLDVVMHTDTFLAARDSLCLYLTSKLMSIRLETSPMWKQRCAAHFQFSDPQAWDLDCDDYKTLYLFLWRFRKYIGLFARGSSPHGGLLLSSIRKRCLHMTLILCRGEALDTDDGHNCLPNDRIGFQQFQIADIRGKTPGTARIELRSTTSARWNISALKNGFLIGSAVRGLRTRYTSLKSFSGGERIPSHLDGLYAGHYFAHKWEILKVTVERPEPGTLYGDREKVIFVQKVSGDPNVPASQMSFQAHFPEDKVYDEIETDKHIRSEYRGAGQIAHEGFRHATWIEGSIKHNVESDTLDLVWGEFSSIRLYRIDKNPIINAALQYDYESGGR